MRTPLAPKIDTLVQDIYDLFEKDVHVPPEDAKSFGDGLAGIVVEQLTKRRPPYLRLSNLGTSCSRKLWFSLNTPELAERMPGHVRIKFLIGHITEAVVLFLARLSGHAVTNEQQELELHGVKGHIDADIDDELVDVKSCSPASFKKFKIGLNAESDGFGYLSQLGTYGEAKGKSRGHFLAVDKVLGALHLDSHDLPKVDYAKKIADAREILDQTEMPERTFSDVKDGESGNRKLGLVCSYCDFKFNCWQGLKVYDYAGQPRFLTVVKREPRVEKL